MSNDLPQGNYGLYNEQLGWGHVFTLPGSHQLTEEALAAQWRIIPLELVPMIEMNGPAFEPPIDAIANLETNYSARYPFPTLRTNNPLPPRQLSNIKYITIHHSAGQRATTHISYWHRLHTQTKSWSRVGYHLAIASWNSGDPIKLYQVNRLSEFSWHDSRNADTVGVTMAGDLRAGRDGEPNEVQLDCFGRCMAWLVPQLPNLEAIVGHKYWQATACPGDIHRWRDKLVDAARQYRQEIDELIRLEKPSRVGVALRNIRAWAMGEPPIAHYKDV